MPLFSKKSVTSVISDAIKMGQVAINEHNTITIEKPVYQVVKVVVHKLPEPSNNYIAIRMS